MAGSFTLGEEVVLPLRWLEPRETADLELPAYETDGSAGLDVRAAVPGEVRLLPGDRALIPTGFAVEVPDGCELQVRPRSGLAIRYGITVINAPGTIDADYRGEVRVGLVNLGTEPYTVRRGDRIAQLVLAPVLRARPVAVQRLGETSRGSGGFGHTGV